MEELAKSGNKYTPEDVIAVSKTSDGKLVWLEKGSNAAGLEHVLKHTNDFARKGIAAEKIPSFLIEAVTKGKIVGMQGPKPIYEVVFEGKVQWAAIGVGSNGYIVGANPVSWPQ